MTGSGGGVDFFTKKNLPAKTVDAPTHSTFEIMGTDHVD